MSLKLFYVLISLNNVDYKTLICIQEIQVYIQKLVNFTNSTV